MKNEKPIIGIVTSMLRHELDTLEKVATSYTDSVTRNGGIPLILPNQAEHILVYLGHVDACLFIGGTNDIDPGLYGADNTHSRNVTREKDDVEIGFLDACIRKEMPVLGICRGMQLLNVYFGGSLTQDVQSDIPHNQYQKQHEYVHDILVSGSEVLPNGTHRVNSVHHQAVRELGKNLRATATAPDGIIEMVEHASLPVIGVEWHPECLDDAVSRTLFTWLVQQSKMHQKS